MRLGRLHVNHEAGVLIGILFFDQAREVRGRGLFRLDELEAAGLIPKAAVPLGPFGKVLGGKLFERCVIGIVKGREPGGELVRRRGVGELRLGPA